MNVKSKLLKKNKINVFDYNIFLYDFDGLLTDNYFYLSHDGTEFTKLFRSDELAIKIFKSLGIEQIILSSSYNKTIKFYSKKWKIKSFIGVKDKSILVKNLYKKNKALKICYFGNDNNDLTAAKKCDLVICPRDAYPKMFKLCNYYTSVKGGHGVLREFLEKTVKLPL